MNREDLEFLISQFLDGILPPQEAAALRDLIDRDPQAMALFEEHRKLDTLIKTALPMPQLSERQWDALSNQISAVVAEADVADAVHGPTSLRGVEGMRVGDIDIAKLKATRSRGLAMPWVANVARLAIAASILLVVGAGIRYWIHTGGPVAQKPIEPQRFAQVDITDANIEVAAGKPVDQITIGPASTLTKAQADSQFADSVVDQGEHVVIASHIQPMEDSSLPY